MKLCPVAESNRRCAYVLEGFATYVMESRATIYTGQSGAPVRACIRFAFIVSQKRSNQANLVTN